jgi:hypothetical protein
MGRLTWPLPTSTIATHYLFLLAKGNAMNIRRTIRSGRICSVLTYWYRGVRYRPVLGYNLTMDQEREAALQIMTAIHANTVQQSRSPKESFQAPIKTNLTFSEFVPIYRQYLNAKRPGSDGRNDIILNLHIIPFFGGKRLLDIRLEDGLAYLAKRSSDITGPKDNRRRVAAGSIERECAVLMAVLNLAVDMDHVDKNRLKRLPVPEYVKRERVLDGWELLKLREAASPKVWRMIMAALQIGLRQNKLIEMHEEWVMQRGRWMVDGAGARQVKDQGCTQDHPAQWPRV